MKKIDEFLNKPFIKSLILSVFTLFIGGVCSSMGNWDFEEDATLKYKMLLLVLSSILYVVFLAYYSAHEFNANKVLRLYEKQNESYEELLSGIMSACRKGANGANEVIHSIIKDSEANLKIWNFDVSCRWVCENVYNLLCKIGDGKDFEVIYVRLIEDGEYKGYAYINAYANKNKQKPSIYNKKRKIIDNDFHDMELFNKSQSDVEILIGKEEIDSYFAYQTKEKRNKNKNKYTQYIAIPIFCNDEKMIGLLEVICMGNTKLGNNKEEIEEIISKYFIPYSFLLLVLHKLEKALIAKPIEKKD